MSKFQYLTLPVDECQLEAGRKDYDYFLQHGFEHYGHDYGNKNRDRFNVVSSGDGTVMFALKERGSLLNVVGIKYNSVFIPKTGIVANLIVRYFHLETLSITKGAVVKRGTILGKVSGKNDNVVNKSMHVHVEIDTDYEYYDYSPQVASNCLYLKKGYTGSWDTTVNPADVFYIGENQTFRGHNVNTFYNSVDIISRKLPTEKKYQKLILPSNRATVTAGYKNTKYESLVVGGIRLGKHYGLDMIGTYLIYASGDGTVMNCGYDNTLGYVVAIKYENVLNHKTGEIISVVFRYNHLKYIKVTKGQKVNKDTELGAMGNTGKYSQGTHLHIEVDTDTNDAYSCWTPTLKYSSNIMKAGTDSTINPAEVLHVKPSAPDYQSITRLYDGYSSDSDIKMPII